MACLVSGPLSPKGPLVYQPVLTATENHHNEDDNHECDDYDHHNLVIRILRMMMVTMMMIVLITMLINLNMTLFKEVECPDPVSPQSGYIEVGSFIYQHFPQSTRNHNHLHKNNQKKGHNTHIMKR